MNILILDDHPLVRSGIKTILSPLQEKDMIFEADNISSALKSLACNNIDIALVDLKLGKESGIDFIEKAKQYKPYTKYIVLTSSMKQDDFKNTQKLNVDGYILKDAFIEDILYAINIVQKGKKYIDPEIMQFTVANSYNQLTPREYDIMLEVGKGLSNSDIAKKLFISDHTVKKHISSILSKLELSNRTEIALYVLNTGTFPYIAV